MYNLVFGNRNLVITIPFVARERMENKKSLRVEIYPKEASMLKALNKTELMTVNGGGKYVRAYKIVWMGSYYQKVYVGSHWVSSDYPYSEIRVY